MREAIQSSDNLFYLMELIKTVSIASELNMDNHLFGEKILQDILFIDNLLSSLTNQIEKNKINHTTLPHLRVLLKSRAAYKDALEEVTQENRSLFPEKNQIELILSILNAQDKRVTELIALMSEIEKINLDEVFITNEEMSILLEEEN